MACSFKFKFEQPIALACVYPYHTWMDVRFQKRTKHRWQWAMREGCGTGYHGIRGCISYEGGRVHVHRLRLQVWDLSRRSRFAKASAARARFGCGETKRQWASTVPSGLSCRVRYHRICGTVARAGGYRRASPCISLRRLLVHGLVEEFETGDRWLLAIWLGQ